MTLFQAVLMSAAFLCSLVSGFLFAFAVVVMPGIRSLDDGEFLQAFRVIDRVIQNNQPLFVVVWVGSVLAVGTVAVLSVWALSGADRALAFVAALLYLLAVQLPTIAVNIPLNNRLQTLEPDTMSEAAREHARDDFEPRWNRWNQIRTACASLVTLVMLLLLLRG